MGFTVKYLFYHMDGVSDNDDFGNVFLAVCLVDTTSNGKELCFCASDKSCIVNCLNQRMVTYVNVRYQCSDIVLNASICYDDCCMW